MWLIHMRSIQVIGLAFGLIGTVILALGYFDLSERRTKQEWDEDSGFGKLREKEKIFTLAGLFFIAMGFLVQIIALAFPR